MEDSGVEQTPEQTETEENTKTSRSPSTDESDSDEEGPISIEHHPVDAHISYEDEYKPCPQCISVSPKKRRRVWTCENDNCGVIEFTTGWNERWDGEKFLQNIDWCKVEEELQDILRFE